MSRFFYLDRDPVEKADEILQRADTFKSWDRRKYMTRAKLNLLEKYFRDMDEAKNLLTKDPHQRAEKAYIEYCKSRVDNHLNDPITIVEWKDMRARLEDIAEDAWNRMDVYAQRVVRGQDCFTAKNTRTCLTQRFEPDSDDKFKDRMKVMVQRLENKERK
jgi:hypothetical protein